jgi:hypothetical protein
LFVVPEGVPEVVMFVNSFAVQPVREIFPVRARLIVA